MLLKTGIILVAVGCMMGDSECLIVPVIVIALGVYLIAKGGGFRYDDEMDEC